MRSISISKLKLTVAAFVIAAGAFFAYGAVTQAVGDEKNGDCTSNAVIYCGVKSMKELRQKYSTDYTKGTKNIFSHFGLTSNVINNYKVQKGVVYKNGDVKVDGKLVATNAHSAGREYLPGSTKHTVGGTTFYTRPLSVSTPPSWSVYVFTDKNGQFVAAVMLACGNPVKATPVKPKPQPKPVYACVSVTRLKQNNDTYIFRGKAKVQNGAVFTGFTYNFGDGTTKYVAHTKHEKDTSVYKHVDAKHTYAKAGTFNVKLTAHFKVNNKTVTKTSDNCQKPVSPTKTPPPAVKVAKCVNLEAKRIGKKSFELTATAKVAGGATISSYAFTIRNLSTNGNTTDPVFFNKRIDTKATTASVQTGELTTLELDKTYRATVAVTTSEGVKTSQNCTVEITTGEKEQPKMVKVCDLETKDTARITEQQLEENPDRYTTDLDKCKEVPPVEEEVVVCNPETGKIIAVKESEADNYVDKDSEECKEKPVVKGVVKELPQTGLAEQLSGLLGLGAMTTAIYYYAMSRRNG